MNGLNTPWDAWARCLGEAYVKTAEIDLAEYLTNATALKRSIPGVLQPGSAEEVQEIVRIANLYKTPLYPISAGKNWGYGSRLPVREGSVVVDLGRLNRVRNADRISVRDHFAVVEPGVTQGQLYDLIESRQLPLMLNTTGAGPDTSIIGNCLERGVGYLGMRAYDLSNLEVVLGNGECIQTGFGAYPKAQAASHYPFGLGPSLDGLFFQSNYGIVTAASFKLVPKRPFHAAVIAKLKYERELEVFVRKLAEIRRQGLVESVMHVGSPSRVRVTLSPLVYKVLVDGGARPSEVLRSQVEACVLESFKSSWTAVGPLFGTRAQVMACFEGIQDELGETAELSLISEEQFESVLDESNTEATMQEVAIRESTKPLLDLCLGVPSSGALESPLWAVGEDSAVTECDLDASNAGILFCSPCLPNEPSLVVETVRGIERHFSAEGFESFITMNFVNSTAVLLITNLAFPKNDRARRESAHRAVKSLILEWASSGIFPYRLGVQDFENAPRQDPAYQKVLKGLKDSMDPNGILSRGHYLD